MNTKPSLSTLIPSSIPGTSAIPGEDSSRNGRDPIREHRDRRKAFAHLDLHVTESSSSNPGKRLGTIAGTETGRGRRDARDKRREWHPDKPRRIAAGRQEMKATPGTAGAPFPYTTQRWPRPRACRECIRVPT